jgi:hypothetical protein
MSLSSLFLNFYCHSQGDCCNAQHISGMFVSSWPVTKLISKAHKQQIVIVWQIKAPLVNQHIQRTKTRFIF